MKWSNNLRTLRRGVKLATRIAKAKLEAPAVEPVAPAEDSRLVDSQRLFARVVGHPGVWMVLMERVRHGASETGAAPGITRAFIVATTKRS